jgi:hypothetical protein
MGGLKQLGELVLSATACLAVKCGHACELARVLGVCGDWRKGVWARGRMRLPTAARVCHAARCALLH